MTAHSTIRGPPTPLRSRTRRAGSRLGRCEGSCLSLRIAGGRRRLCGALAPHSPSFLGASRRDRGSGGGVGAGGGGVGGSWRSWRSRKSFNPRGVEGISFLPVPYLLERHSARTSSTMDCGVQTGSQPRSHSKPPHMPHGTKRANRRSRERSTM